MFDFIERNDVNPILLADLVFYEKQPAHNLKQTNFGIKMYLLNLIRNINALSMHQVNLEDLYF